MRAKTFTLYAFGGKIAIRVIMRKGHSLAQLAMPTWAIHS